MNKKRLFKSCLLGLVSLFSVLTLTGCGFTPVSGTVVEKYETRVMRTVKPYTRKHCFRLVVLDKNFDKHQRCVSEGVYNSAALNQHINLTKEHH